MKRAEILTPWAGTGGRLQDAYHPQLIDDYVLIGTRDVTGQPSDNLTPEPNLYVLLVECEDAVLAAIEADPIYEVLWSEEA